MAQLVEHAPTKLGRLGSIPCWVIPKTCQTVPAPCPSSLVLGTDGWMQENGSRAFFDSPPHYSNHCRSSADSNLWTIERNDQHARRVIAACELCCFLPQCEALRTCRSGFSDHNSDILQSVQKPSINETEVSSPLNRKPRVILPNSTWTLTIFSYLTENQRKCLTKNVGCFADWQNIYGPAVANHCPNVRSSVAKIGKVFPHYHSTQTTKFSLVRSWSTT